MRGPASSSPALPLLRRWRAWQLQHQPHSQARPFARTTPNAAAAAAAAARSPPTQTTPTPTQHQRVVASVAAALARLGVHPGLGSEVCDGLITVDLALQLENKRLVAVDVTPRPPDVLPPPAAGGSGSGGRTDPDPAATGRPRPSAENTPQRAWALAQARRQALKAHGWHYVQLPAVEWLGAMGDAEEEEAMLRERVLAEEAAHVCGSGCSH